MNNVETLTGVSVSVGQYTSEVVNIASRCLEGVYDDYYFFQYDSNNGLSCFVLLVGDLDFGSNVVSAEECKVFQIYENISYVPHSASVNAPFNGYYVGAPSSGSVQGNSSITYVDRYDVHKTYYLTSYTGYNVSVSNNTGYLEYGSADNMPHLVEGGQNYAFAAFCLAFGVIAFKLGDRLFRRVY